MPSRKKLNQVKFFKAPIIQGQTSISIELPQSVAKHVKLDGKEVYWTITNGIIQISGVEPTLTIPILLNNPRNFLAQ
jgi:hypothetical protein